MYMKILAKNKRAYFDYNILDKLDAGIELLGPEVKSVRAGQVSLKGSYVVIQSEGPNKKMEAWLLNASISAYPPAGPDFKKSYDPERSRKLLLHKKEISHLLGKQKEKGLTLVPLVLYTSGKRIKLKIGVGQGKKKYEKRDTIKERQSKRSMERAMKERG